MLTTKLRWFVFCLTFAMLLLPAAVAQPRAAQAYGHLPLSFEANHGQTAGQVKFLSRGPGYTLFLTPTESVLKTPKSALRVALVGANPRTQLSGLEERPGHSNYLIGNDPSRWRTGVRQYGKVRYAGVYPGIDLIYYGNPQDLEYDFVVAPGADPGAIALQVHGGRPRLEASGDLLVPTPGGEVRLHRPVIYQEHDGARNEIEGGYVIEGRSRVRFRLGAYDHQNQLVIDPTFLVARYLGGSGSDYINGLATDSAGNAYVTGQTNSANLPTTSGALRTTLPGGSADAFVTKLDPSGNIIYSTFLGGGGYDGGAGIAVGSDGSAYVIGTTSSSDFPTANAFQSTFKGVNDGFLVKLNPAGSALVYSTYIGGSGSDFASGLALGSDGSAYVVGSTTSNNFPTLGAFQPAAKSTSSGFVAKFNPSGTLAYSSYLGGSGFDSGNAVAVDTQGNAYVGGNTGSSDFPVTSGAFQKTYGGNTDGFIAKVNPTGSALVYATYLGGSANDVVRGIVLDGPGNAWLTGFTASTNFPTAFPIQAANGGGTDFFVSLLDLTGAKLIFSTYFGGNGEDLATGIAFLFSPDAKSVRVGIAGVTNSTNLVLTSAARGSQAAEGCGNLLLLILAGAESDAGGYIIVDNTFVADEHYYDLVVACDSTPAVIAKGSIWLAGNLSGSASEIPGTPPGGSADAYLLRMAVPEVPQGAVVNATFGKGTGLTPGGISSVFGTTLAAATAGASGVPLANAIQGTSVQLVAPPGAPKVTVQAPLYFVSPGQVNFQMPWELAGQTQASLSVISSGIAGAPLTISLAPVGPGIFTTNSQGTGQGAIQISNTATFAAPAGSIPGVDARPATAGDFLTIYATGLGDVSNRPATGAPAPGGPLAATVVTPTATIGGVNAPVAFSGLSPGFVGLYQVNVQVPAGVTPGNAVPVVISIGGVASNTATIAVQ